MSGLNNNSTDILFPTHFSPLNSQGSNCILTHFDPLNFSPHFIHALSLFSLHRKLTSHRSFRIKSGYRCSYSRPFVHGLITACYFLATIDYGFHRVWCVINMIAMNRKIGMNGLFPSESLYFHRELSRSNFAKYVIRTRLLSSLTVGINNF